ncbi:AraC family transcriptional regulator [Putridiphycobacter roseus]|uniref:AraC family transcriptional regulator n=1 Tax=Putridiphycobacter roseus TaxID=2219161 RepID=A0A2W1NEG0_9FLAO|nr:AraC family transcriptional regulator [Putridiphycobacter roseus]PZE16456.1 AraC family transcriptional regulator [Putridiphycobacter roseus]
MNSAFPIYSIKEFQSTQHDNDFYANYANVHIKGHHFTKLPHKHDFYLIILFTKGSGKHEIDFETYQVKPGTLFILKPGEMHYWELSDDIDGFVFFHTKDFYDKRYVTSSLKDFAFFASFQSSPIIHVSEATQLQLEGLMLELVLESQKNELLKWEKIHALITMVYISISREYIPTYKVKSVVYLKKVREFEDVIESNFKSIKFAKEYAAMLNITEKHLNRVTKACFNKTSTQLISERIMLEAKRMLMHSEYNVNQISEALGFNETSYFIRFFKKHTGLTPLHFLHAYLEKKQ